jgi:hypothetical protein
MLNYLSRRRSPTRYIKFVPPGMLMFGEDAMLQAFRAGPPESAVLAPKNDTEYGEQYEYFSRTCSRGIGAWGREEYRPVVRIGGEPFTDKVFGMLVLERKPPAG